MSDFLEKIQKMSWEEYWDEYKKIAKAFTKEELPKKHKIIFGKVVNLNTFSKSNQNNPKQVLVKNIANMGALRTKNALAYAIRNSENDFAINEKRGGVKFKRNFKRLE